MIAFTQLGNKGNFGNQLFQYAYLRSMARKLGVKFYCPHWIGDELFDLNDQDERVSKMDENITNTYFEYGNCGFNEASTQVKDQTNCYGYFQSEKYFIDRNEVLKWYTFKDEIKKVENEISGIDFKNAVTLSARLGDDYTNLMHLYPRYSMKYYKRGLSCIDQNRHVLVFSDHPDRAREYFANLNLKNATYVEGPGPYEQMYLMTLCQDHVITNSTFAWWGAWLNPKEDKKVVVPEEWFRPGVGVFVKDIQCDDWITVKSLNPVLDHAKVWPIKTKVKWRVKKLLNR